MVSDMATPRSQKENYSCCVEIMNIAVCEGLREIFKQEWDKQYGRTKGVWDDTCISGNELWIMEKSNPRAKDYLNVYQSGKRSEWDMSALSYAILFSNAIKRHLAPHVTDKVDELRVLRNQLTHKFGSQHKMPDAAFDNACNKVKNCFTVLKLSRTNVDKIIDDFEKRRLILSRNNSFRKRRLLFAALLVLLLGVITHFLTHTSEDKSLFRHLPTRPVHLIANRSQTVDVILDELRNLSVGNKNQLTYFYVTGNPGSGKSQLARLVGQRYGNDNSGIWIRSAPRVFVMTLNGRSLNDILESYLDFAGRLNCPENDIAGIKNSNRTTADEKIQKLQREIARRLRNTKGGLKWLLIVDNVINVNEIISYLPKLGNDDWQGGQVLITTQDMSSVPPNGTLTVHISVSQGMHLAESRRFLMDLSGLVDNEDTISKVAEALDYQPLALAAASFYVKQIRGSKVSSQFTWKDYLKKLDEGKRVLTEIRLKKVNKQAYSLSMSTAVLLAVKRFAESNSVLKHVFTFLSYVSYELQSLQAVVSYVFHVDKKNDKEDIELIILQCSLIVHSEEQKVASFSLHRVVHQGIKMYVEKQKEGKNEALYIIQLLLSEKCALGEISLTPHLKALSAGTKNLTSISLEQASIKSKQEIHRQIFDLSEPLLRYGEHLLLKHYLIFALKLASEKKYSYDLFPNIGKVFHNLGAVENQLGNTAEARTYTKKGLDILSKQYGPKHESVSTCLLTLASIPCSTPKECDENESYTKRMLRIDKSLQTKCLYHISKGNKHYTVDELTQAIEHYQQALKILQNITETERNDEKYVRMRGGMDLASLNLNLAAVYHRLGKFKQAKILLNTSIHLKKLLGGPRHLSLGNSYFNLGLVHFELKELSEAEKCYRRAREIYSHHLEPSDERMIYVLQNLADTLEKTGKLDEAHSLRKQYGIGKCNQK